MKSKLVSIFIISSLFLSVYRYYHDDSQLITAKAASGSSARRVNVPYTDAVTPNVLLPEGAIFWLGQVTPVTNYADVRTIYADDKLHVAVHIFDNALWYDSVLPVEDLSGWDAATIYLNLTGTTGNTPTNASHQFIAQLKQNPPRDGYDAAYQGNGTAWMLANTAFETSTNWRGNGINNGADARGWYAIFSIPFASLGLAGPPPPGTVWGLAVAVHDRDDMAGTPIVDQIWPENMMSDQPASWGELHFGLPVYEPPNSSPDEVVTIQNGLNGVTVVDGAVGGHSICASDIHPDYFQLWGSLNYEGYHQINIQNQWDLADWPCFSKYYITFPLDSLPTDQHIISATLTMYHFGNSMPTEAEPSLIQVMRIDEEWNEATLTWNNAPLASENYGGTWVEPLPLGPSFQPVTWDLSRAVADAYAADSDLRLVLYSADSPQHSGKYFYATESTNAAFQPTLKVLMGEPDLFSVTPSFQWVEPGGQVGFTIEVPDLSGVNAPVSFVVTNPDVNELMIDEPGEVIPPAQVMLEVSSLHPGSELLPGLFYSIPIQGVSNGITHEVEVTLLVGGTRAWLPFVSDD